MARNEGTLDKRLYTETEHNPSMIFDEQGRLKRWEFIDNGIKAENTKYCGKRNKLENHEYDALFIEKLNNFQSKLHNELEVRRRAIANWKRLRIIIVMLQFCGGRKAMGSGMREF